MTVRQNAECIGLCLTGMGFVAGYFAATYPMLGLVMGLAPSLAVIVVARWGERQGWWQ